MDTAKFARRVRRGIAKAQQAGARVIPSDNRRLFAELYAASMERKQAPQRWRWSEEYIDAHFAEPIDARLFHVAAGGGERMLMTVGAFGTAYAHLLASNGEATGLGLDEMLYCEAAKMLANDGYQYFHLGGGRSSSYDDSLLLFKSGFAHPTHKLFEYRRVFFPSIYDELYRRKRQDEIDKYGQEIPSSFFPAYRREAA
jgi:lipid II:glycine glycyltransferase (peptidoglycan interpeptide bridge formation enzyme)